MTIALVVLVDGLAALAIGYAYQKSRPGSRSRHALVSLLAGFSLGAVPWIVTALFLCRS